MLKMESYIQKSCYAALKERKAFIVFRRILHAALHTTEMCSKHMAPLRKYGPFLE